MTNGLLDLTKIGQSMMNLPTEVMNTEIKQVQEKMNVLNVAVQSAGLPPVPVPAGGQALALPPLPGVGAAGLPGLPGLPMIGQQAGRPTDQEVAAQAAMMRSQSQRTERPRAYVDY